jgi:hypothetical protein
MTSAGVSQKTNYEKSFGDAREDSEGGALFLVCGFTG